jgi:hypothetical protein
LTHRFFVVQLRVPDGGPFTLELDFLDAARRRRRLVFSSAFKAVDRTELHVKVPLPLVALLPCGVWVDLVFDVHELAASSFGDGTPTKTAQRKSSRSAAATDAQTCFAALTAVTIGPTCTVRRIFTLGRSPAASVETSYGGDGDVSSAFASSGAIPAKHACPGGAQLCIVTMPSVVAALAALAPSTRAKVAPARRAGRNVAFGRRSSPAALVASGGGGGNTVGSARRARARPATAASRSRATASTRAPAAQQRQRPATTGSRTRPRNAGAASRTPALGAAARPRSRSAARERRATSSTAVRRAATSSRSLRSAAGEHIFGELLDDVGGDRRRRGAPALSATPAAGRSRNPFRQASPSLSSRVRAMRSPGSAPTPTPRSEVVVEEYDEASLLRDALQNYAPRAAADAWVEEEHAVLVKAPVRMIDAAVGYGEGEGSRSATPSPARTGSAPRSPPSSPARTLSRSPPRSRSPARSKRAGLRASFDRPFASPRAAPSGSSSPMSLRVLAAARRSFERQSFERASANQILQSLEQDERVEEGIVRLEQSLDRSGSSLRVLRAARQSADYDASDDVGEAVEESVSPSSLRRGALESRPHSGASAASAVRAREWSVGSAQLDRAASPVTAAAASRSPPRATSPSAAFRESLDRSREDLCAASRSFSSRSSASAASPAASRSGLGGRLSFEAEYAITELEGREIAGLDLDLDLDMSAASPLGGAASPLGETEMLEGLLAREQAHLLALETQGQQLDFEPIAEDVAPEAGGRGETARGEEEMLYDPVLNAYYDPVEGKFYRLK